MVRYFQVGSEVAKVTTDEDARMFIENGGREVTLVPKRNPVARALGYAFVFGLALLAVGIVALGIKIIWTAVLS